MTTVKLIATLAFAFAWMPLAAHADVLEARSAADIALSPSAGANVTVLSLALPVAGQYRAVAKVSFGNFTGREDYARCAITLDGVALDGSVTVVGGANAPTAATLVTQARVTTTTPNHTVGVVCNHDHTFAGIVASAGATLELSNAPAGPKGDPGLAGVQGPVGPPGAATFGVCVGVNAANPTSAYCSCLSGKTLSQVQTAGTCTAVTQSGSCSASGYVPPAASGGSGVYTGACCACNS